MSDSKKLYVQGIEVTQAIQYYRSDMHLFDPQDQQPDNSAWLVAQKPAWVRVYVRSGSSDTVHGVTGKLRVERYAPSSSVTELTPEGPGVLDAYPEPDQADAPFIAADALYKLERKDITATLNFVIPSHLVCGNLRLIAHVWAAKGLSHEKAILVDATHRQRIWFRGVMIGYDDPNLNDKVDPPTMADLHATSYWTMLVYPVSSAVYIKADEFMLSQPLATTGCTPGDPGWAELKMKLLKAADADNNLPGAIYYGLIAQDVPGAGGCGGPDDSGLFGWASGYSITPDLTKQTYAERVMAHEIGHALRRDHVRGCVLPIFSAPNDPNYPAYEPYDWPDAPGASIGEYGLNINTAEILSPAIYKDFMSYCPKDMLWVSLYGHQKATFHPWLHPEPVCPPSISTKIPLYHDPKYYLPDPTTVWITEELKPVISVVGVLDIGEEFAIGYVRRTLSYTRSQGARTAYVATLEDADGQELARGHMFRIASSAMPEGSCACGCSGEGDHPPFLLKAMLPDVAPGAVLRVTKDGEEIWSRNAPAEAPRVLDVSAEINRHDRLALQWRVEDPQPDEIEYWVRWSADKGESWHSLRTDITKTEAEFSLEGLPAGQVLLQVVAHDGFFSVMSEPAAVTVPPQPPIITILHPREGEVLATGRTLRLWAVATSFGEEFEPHDFLWLVNGREAGRGLDVWTVAPDDGEHVCTLRLEAEHERVQQIVTFRTAVPPDPRQSPRPL